MPTGGGESFDFLSRGRVGGLRLKEVSESRSMPSLGDAASLQVAAGLLETNAKMRGCPLRISPEVVANCSTNLATSSTIEEVTNAHTLEKKIAKMTAKTAPEAAFGVLPRADGSAKYSHAGYSVLASVNGPIEAQRRDEHAYEAHVDVIVRPAAGVGGESPRANPQVGQIAHS